jgi:predicted membrane-bound spermidine synthase
MDLLALGSAWLASALIVAAALVPLGHRVLRQRRAVLASPSIKGHAVLGLSAIAMAVAHTFAIVPALGSPAAIRGGMTALAPATVAFFLLFAHVGIGLRLRDPKLRERPRFRRRHVVLASVIVAAVAAHVVGVALAR